MASYRGDLYLYFVKVTCTVAYKCDVCGLGKYVKWHLENIR